MFVGESITLTRGTDSLVLPNYQFADKVITSGWALNDFQGWDFTGVEWQSEKSPQQHGSTVNGFNLTERDMALSYFLMARDRLSMMRLIQQRNKFFTIGRDPFTLAVDLPDGTRRQIDCRYVDGMTGSAALDDSNTMNSTLYAAAIRAYAPLWQDANFTTVEFELNLGSAYMTVPTVIPTAIGNSTLDAVQRVQYDGTFKAGPLITIRGPVTNLSIVNESTGEKIGFPLGINATQNWQIDCRSAYRRVLAMYDGTEHTGELSDDSDLATFHIAPASEVPDGINSFRVTGDNASSSTRITVQWQAAYQSLV